MTGCRANEQPTRSACAAALRCAVAVSRDRSRENARWKPVTWSGGANWAPTARVRSTVSVHTSPCADGQLLQPTKRKPGAASAESVSSDPACHVQRHVDGCVHATLGWLESTTDRPPAPTVTRTPYSGASRCRSHAESCTSHHDPECA